MPPKLVSHLEKTIVTSIIGKKISQLNYRYISLKKYLFNGWYFLKCNFFFEEYH